MRSTDRVRGQPTNDMFDDSVETREDILICEAQNGPASAVQELLAPTIVSELVFRPMRLAVDLDDKPPPDVRKIRNVGSDGMLPTKFETVAVGFAK